MKQLFLKREGNPRLLLFFAGWGADEHLFHRPVPQGYDYLLCFDYRTLDFDEAYLEGYQEIYVMAWSMGVWVAGYVLSNASWPVIRSLAVNGTVYPIDDERGIPHAIFEGTLQGFSEKTLVRFRRRMCGTQEGVKAFLAHEPYRPLEELREELAALKQEVQAKNTPTFHWDKAIVGLQDLIFPVNNQQKAWERVEMERLNIAHYDECLFDNLLSGKEEGWIRL